MSNYVPTAPFTLVLLGSSAEGWLIPGKFSRPGLHLLAATLYYGNQKWQRWQMKSKLKIVCNWTLSRGPQGGFWVSHLVTPWKPGCFSPLASWLGSTRGAWPLREDCPLGWNPPLHSRRCYRARAQTILSLATLQRLLSTCLGSKSLRTPWLPPRLRPWDS